jgi:hypothetical protein
MFGVTKDNQVGRGVDGNGRVPETVEEEVGLLPKGDVIKSGLLESGMCKLDDRDDFVTVDGEERGVRRKVTGEDPRVCCTVTTLGGGFVEDDDFGLVRGDCQTEIVRPLQSPMDSRREIQHGRRAPYSNPRTHTTPMRSPL